VKFAQVTPVAITHDYESGWEKPIHAAPNGLGELRRGKLFDRISVRRLNRELPLSLLVEILSLEDLDQKLRKSIALAAWTRALLLQDEEKALGLGPLVEELSPGLGPELEAYRASLMNNAG
jgi:predicted component of type VI protein secretion system